MDKIYHKAFQFIYCGIFLCFISCNNSDNDYIEQSPVVVDLTQVPYPKLSDYLFFEGEGCSIRHSHVMSPSVFSHMSPPFAPLALPWSVGS